MRYLLTVAAATACLLTLGAWASRTCAGAGGEIAFVGERTSIGTAHGVLCVTEASAVSQDAEDLEDDERDHGSDAAITPATHGVASGSLRAPRDVGALRHATTAAHRSTLVSASRTARGPPRS